MPLCAHTRSIRPQAGASDSAAATRPTSSGCVKGSGDAVTASFAYVDGGVAGPFTTFGATADIFRGENFTRAEFLFLEPTPEPATLLLFGTTAAGLGLARWRQRRRQQP
jgi:hypothetical protein